MKKSTWIAAILFALYLVLVVVAARALHFEAARQAIFCAALALIGALGLVVSLIYKRDVIDVPAVHQSDTSSLDALVRSAETHLKASLSNSGAPAPTALLYVLGDENSAKTQIVLQSGLDAEHLAGTVYSDNVLAPTPLANIWYSASTIVVEAGGALLRQPGLWQQLVRLTQPGKLGTADTGDAQPSTRAAVLCVSIDRVTASNSLESVRALGHMLNERLRLLSQTLGLSLPVYVVFTKLDSVPSFAEFAANLAAEDVRQPVGALLPRPEAGTGNYAERASAKVGERFDELMYSLSKFRVEVLTRGGEPAKLAKAYEFPREFRKMRATIVELLVEAGRPSQLEASAFLRGFYFVGMRAQVVEDGIGDRAVAQPTATPDATSIFYAGQVAQAPILPPRRNTRRVPQWVFLPQLFSGVVLNDHGALDTSRVAAKANPLKRYLLGSVAACFFLYAIALTISYAQNASLADHLRSAADVPAPPAADIDAASLSDLQNLEQLRLVFTRIASYRGDGVPLSYRFGLYPGDRLYNKACAAYGSHFRTLLLSPAQTNILVQLRALPATPESTADVEGTARSLRAYLVTTSHPEKNTPGFLPDALQKAWVNGRTFPQNATDLSMAQFETYASTLSEPNSCMAALGGPTQDAEVNQARTYLSHVEGMDAGKIP